MDLDKYIIFIGNPGTGKSAILNGIFGDCAFQSGYSIGQGMTKVLQLSKHSNGIIYGDTPGLSDINRRQQAAEEIRDSLRQNGIYRLFFVVTLDAGRIKADDKTTIRLILDAIQIDILFGVIINKATKRSIRDLSDKESEEYKLLQISLNEGLPVVTDAIYLIPYDPEIDDEDGMQVSLESDFYNFLNNCPPTIVAPEYVSDIKYNEFEEMKEELRNLQQIINNIEQDRNLFDTKILMLQEEHKRNLEAISNRHEQLLVENTQRLRDEALKRHNEQMVIQQQNEQRIRDQIRAEYEDRLKCELAHKREQQQQEQRLQEAQRLSTKYTENELAKLVKEFNQVYGEYQRHNQAHRGHYYGNYSYTKGRNIPDAWTNTRDRLVDRYREYLGYLRSPRGYGSSWRQDIN